MQLILSYNWACQAQVVFNIQKKKLRIVTICPTYSMYIIILNGYALDIHAL
jgi:hypothetical protein